MVPSILQHRHVWYQPSVWAGGQEERYDILKGEECDALGRGLHITFKQAGIVYREKWPFCEPKILMDSEIIKNFECINSDMPSQTWGLHFFQTELCPGHSQLAKLEANLLQSSVTLLVKSQDWLILSVFCPPCIEDESFYAAYKALWFSHFTLNGRLITGLHCFSPI